MLATFTTDVSSGQYICIYLHRIKNVLAGNKKLLCVFLFQTITKKKLVTTSSQPLFRLVFHLGFCHTATLVLAVIGRMWMFSHIHTVTRSSTWSNMSIKQNKVQQTQNKCVTWPRNVLSTWFWKLFNTEEYKCCRDIHLFHFDDDTKQMSHDLQLILVWRTEPLIGLHTVQPASLQGSSDRQAARVSCSIRSETSSLNIQRACSS